MKKVLYGISHMESSDNKMHLYLIPGQKLKDGTDVEPRYRVQCDRGIRDSYPQFSIFAFDIDDVSIDPRGTHYVAKKSSMKLEGTITTSASGFKLEEGTSGEPKNFVGTKLFEDTKTLYILTEKEIYVMSPSTRLVPVISETTSGIPTMSIIEEMASTLSEIYKFDMEELRKKYSPAHKKTAEKKSSSTSSAPKPEPKEEEKKSWIDTVIETEKLSTPTAKKDGFYISQSNWKLLIRNIKRHVNTLIVGPTGTGKTSCIKYAAEKLGMKLTIIDMGATIDPISSLLGVHRLKDGHSVFDYAQFTQAIQEPGIILLDEVNRAPMGSGNVLFPCLDDRRILPIEIANGDGPREIKIHPEVSFIATANLGAEYTGTSGVMDRAFLNRFFPLELTYLPDNIEKEVLKQRTGIEEKESDLIVKVANTIRTMNKKMELSMAVSVRETLMISTLVSDGWSLGDAMKTVYLPMFEGTNSEGERSKLYKVLASY